MKKIIYGISLLMFVSVSFFNTTNAFNYSHSPCTKQANRLAINIDVLSKIHHKTALAGLDTPKHIKKTKGRVKSDLNMLRVSCPDKYTEFKKIIERKHKEGQTIFDGLN